MLEVYTLIDCFIRVYLMATTILLEYFEYGYKKFYSLSQYKIYTIDVSIYYRGSTNRV